MRNLRGIPLTLLSVVFLFSLHLLFPVAGAAPTQTTQPPNVACRVLETHTSPQLQLTVVVFHQQDEKDRGRLGSLLRQHSGSSIEFETSRGTRHRATVLRLKSCFGRGLLLFLAGAAHLAEKDEFLLRFPSE